MMACFAEMGGGVLMRRGITAPDMTAGGATAKMQPPAALLETFNAAGTGRSSGGIDGSGHGRLFRIWMTAFA
jgi:hypothetical protein